MVGCKNVVTRLRRWLEIETDSLEIKIFFILLGFSIPVTAYGLVIAFF